MTKHFLLGGEYFEKQANTTFRQETQTVPKHNKLPERIFGYLGFQMEKRPNSSDLTNEAQVMYLLNRPSEFVNSLPKEQLDKLIFNTRRDERKLRDKQQNRMGHIHELLVKWQEGKKKTIEASRARVLKRKEDITCIIIDTELWQNEEQLQQKMDACESNNERYLACKNQIKFRRVVLQQFLEDDKGFTFSEKGKPNPWTMMLDHLKKFINAALASPTSQSCAKTADNESFKCCSTSNREDRRPHLCRNNWKGHIQRQSHQPSTRLSIMVQHYL